jgi:hypothetical protein
MNRFATRTIALAAAATLAVMLAGIGVAVGSPDGGHARVAALSRAVKKLDNRFDEAKGELNDLHNADETNRQGVSYLRRALIAPNVVKVVETRQLEEGGEVTVDAFCPRHLRPRKHRREGPCCRIPDCLRRDRPASMSRS